MASGKKSHHAAMQRAYRLRKVLGVRSPFNLYTVEGQPIAWRQFPDTPASRSLSRQPAQPIVCLHTAGSGSREFSPLLDRIPIGSRLLLLDWPGHGHSSESPELPISSLTADRCAAQLSTVLGQLGVIRPILLGAGFGAAVALHYAANHPSEVMGLVLCQPAGLVAPKPTGNATGKFTGPARRQSMRVKIVSPAMKAIYAEADVSLRESESSLRSALASLTCPILFALSRESRVYPLQTYLRLLDPLLAKAPQHRFTVFTGGFNPIWDEPDRFAQALTGFLQAQLPLAQHQHAWLLAAVDWPTRSMNLWKCVHPDCPAEQVLPEGQNANDTAS